MKQYNFYKQYRMSINSSIPRIDLEIKEAKSDTAVLTPICLVNEVCSPSKDVSICNIST